MVNRRPPRPACPRARRSGVLAAIDARLVEDETPIRGEIHVRWPVTFIVSPPIVNILPSRLAVIADVDTALERACGIVVHERLDQGMIDVLPIALVGERPSCRSVALCCFSSPVRSCHQTEHHGWPPRLMRQDGRSRLPCGSDHCSSSQPRFQMRHQFGAVEAVGRREAVGGVMRAAE